MALWVLIESAWRKKCDITITVDVFFLRGDIIFTLLQVILQ